MEKYHKKTFENISEEKRNRILETATKAFAAKGFSAANINTIAEEAGISIGALYKYFSSKQNLFLYVIQKACIILEQAIDEADAHTGDFFIKIERLIHVAGRYAKQYPELNQIYLDVASQGLSHLSEKLSMKIESVSSNYYKALIETARSDGQIRTEMDTNVAAYCLDNLILMYQYSWTTAYFKNRMAIFTGLDPATDEDKIIEQIMVFVRNAFGQKG